MRLLVVWALFMILYSCSIWRLITSYNFCLISSNSWALTLSDILYSSIVLFWSKWTVYSSRTVKKEPPVFYFEIFSNSFLMRAASCEWGSIYEKYVNIRKAYYKRLLMMGAVDKIRWSSMTYRFKVRILSLMLRNISLKSSTSWQTTGGTFQRLSD